MNLIRAIEINDDRKKLNYVNEDSNKNLRGKNKPFAWPLDHEDRTTILDINIYPVIIRHTPVIYN